MNIPFAGTYNADSLRRFDRAARKALGTSSVYTNAGCFTAGAVILLVLGVSQWIAGNQSGGLQWLVLFAIAAVFAAMQWWSTWRSYARHPNLGQSISGAIGDDALEIKTPTSESKVVWSGIASTFCAADYVILVGATGGLYGIDAAFFRGAEEFAQACQFLPSRVAGKPPGMSTRKRLFRILGLIVLIVFALLVWSLLRPSVRP